MTTHVGLLYSGGLDSTVLLYKLLSEGKTVLPFQFNYGQKHHKELNAGSQILEDLSLVSESIDVSSIKSIWSASCLINDTPVPDGHYEDVSMSITVVPNRNLLMLTLASSLCVVRGVTELYLAVHSGDHHIYPDCRPLFVTATSRVLSASLDCDFQIIAPFGDITKTEIVRLGYALSVPMHLTWSCYKGQELHCGTCGTCVERREAFTMASVADETEYANV